MKAVLCIRCCLFTLPAACNWPFSSSTRCLICRSDSSCAFSLSIITYIQNGKQLHHFCSSHGCWLMFISPEHRCIYEPNLIANSFAQENQFPAMSHKLDDMHGKDVSRKTTPSSQPTTKNTNPPPASHVSPLEIVLVLHIQKPTLHGTLRVLPSEIKQQRSGELINIIWQKSGSGSRVKVRPLGS